VAKGFKDQGNEYFKRKRFREALGFYTQGIDAKPDDPSIREALLSNRAACNLELSELNKLVLLSSVVLKHLKRIMDQFFGIAGPSCL
jgi:hypothetical protein